MMQYLRDVSEMSCRTMAIMQMRLQQDSSNTSRIVRITATSKFLDVIFSTSVYRGQFLLVFHPKLEHRRTFPTIRPSDFIPGIVGFCVLSGTQWILHPGHVGQGAVTPGSRSENVQPHCCCLRAFRVATNASRQRPGTCRGTQRANVTQAYRIQCATLYLGRHHAKHTAGAHQSS